MHAKIAKAIFLTWGSEVEDDQRRGSLQKRDWLIAPVFSLNDLKDVKVPETDMFMVDAIRDGKSPRFFPLDAFPGTEEELYVDFRKYAHYRQAISKTHHGNGTAPIALNDFYHHPLIWFFTRKRIFFCPAKCDNCGELVDLGWCLKANPLNSTSNNCNLRFVDALMTIRSVYETFGEAYKDCLKCVLTEGRTVTGVRDPRSPGSQFGQSVRDTIEIIGHSFKVTDPNACFVVSKARPLRLAYCLGSLAWTLNASDNLEEIAFYNPRGRSFSDDGVHLSGAFGKRLFQYNGHLNQIDVILARLAEDGLAGDRQR